MVREVEGNPREPGPEEERALRGHKSRRANPTGRSRETCPLDSKAKMEGVGSEEQMSMFLFQKCHGG